MLHALFLWIYCMDIHEVLLLLALSSGLFYVAHTRFSRYRFWIPTVLAVLLIWAIAVVALTIFSRTPNDALQPVWRPFQSYFDALQEGGQRELLRSNFMNAVLFYPAGLLLTTILPKNWKPLIRILVILGISVVFSIVIELTQLYHCLGLPQTDDIIHAALGALVGSVIMLILLSNGNKLSCASK